MGSAVLQIYVVPFSVDKSSYRFSHSLSETERMIAFQMEISLINVNSPYKSITSFSELL